MKQQVEIAREFKEGDIVKILKDYSNEGKFGLIKKVSGASTYYPYSVWCYDSELTISVSTFAAHETRKILLSDFIDGDFGFC